MSDVQRVYHIAGEREGSQQRCTRCSQDLLANAGAGKPAVHEWPAGDRVLEGPRGVYHTDFGIEDPEPCPLPPDDAPHVAGHSWQAPEAAP